MSERDKSLSLQFSARCEEARTLLRKHMAERGLREADGWRIHEFTREDDGRVELVMRPVHRHLKEPNDLECVCTIAGPGSDISAECRN